MHDHQGDYGVDGSFHKFSARTQALGVGAQVLALAVWAAISWARGKRLRAGLAAVSSAGIAGNALLYMYATRSGKFVVWDRVLRDLRLAGDETVLDLGCGRGAVLLAAAKRLPRGRAIGVDLWQADQTDNSRQATLANAVAEGVANRVEVRTADMTALPLADESVDVIVSNLAIHNIDGHAGGRRALDEGCCGRAAGSRSRTSGRRVSTPSGCANWAGAMCGGATSAGGCGTAARGSPRGWSPRPNRAEARSGRRACWDP